MKPSIESFLDISVLLTGFNRAELEGTGMAEFYFKFVQEQFRLAPDVLAAFYEEAAEVLHFEGSDQAIAVRKNLLPGACYNGLAVAIINLWYLGNWNGSPVSPQAYVQGLIWPAAGTHPPGAKQPGYGSWGLPPAPFLSLQTAKP
ncbi:hypothetical protein EPD60_00350 [Flaviaesturariibacter flavus]|uniref:Gluconate 2-dehydrogenase subunit 3 family protein n=1 Tax=Flaviaesturariibacter flavus TaxID=2502780 RepID=A0A4R1BPP4_9BACT|nr:hypothetical protein [Flaviaesturariibacter flavus]TCJ19609.1 hypothetical protein EPD60_00350 [Flaviaesturariibacter flavus]